MAKKIKVAAPSESLSPLRPALSTANREAQCIALAMDLVEQRLRDGTATSQETVHFLRLGSERERLERKKLESEVAVAQARVAAFESQARSEELFKEALKAFTRYSGHTESEELGDEDSYQLERY